MYGEQFAHLQCQRVIYGEQFAHLQVSATYVWRTVRTFAVSATYVWRTGRINGTIGIVFHIALLHLIYYLRACVCCVVRDSPTHVCVCCVVQRLSHTRTRLKIKRPPWASGNTSSETPGTEAELCCPRRVTLHCSIRPKSCGAMPYTAASDCGGAGTCPTLQHSTAEQRDPALQLSRTM